MSKISLYRFFILAFALNFCACQLPPPGGKQQVPGTDPQTMNDAIEIVGELASEFEELSKPNKVRAWVDNLIVKDQPGKEMKTIAKMKEGELATYMYQSTSRKSSFTLRGQAYNEPWLLVRTKDSVMGWVHGGGVVFVQPDFITELFTEESPQGTPPAEQTRSLDNLDPTARQSSPPAPSPETTLEREKLDYLVVPGSRVGPVHLATSESDLIKMYGPGVTRSKVRTSGNKMENCSVLHAGTYEEIRIVWKDETRSKVKAIYIDNSKGKWHMKEGVKVGLSMLDLTKVNRAPIQFYGFEWEYSGTIYGYGKGGLAPYSKQFYAVLAPKNPSQVRQQLVGFKGQKEFTSITEGVDLLDLEIDRLVIYLD